MTEGTTLQRGDAVPHFDAKTVAGDAFRYDIIWQRRNLVLVTLPASRADDIHAMELLARSPEFHDRKSALIVTRDQVIGVPTPGVLIADRWGEIVHVAAASDGLPSAEALLEWIDYVEQRCPECEGETR